MKGLSRRQDAYGWSVCDYYRGFGGSEIVERDDGWITVSGGPKAYFSEYKDWRPAQKAAIALSRGRVLDVGCGAGRVGLYLKSKGLDVTGIDNSPLAVKVCRLRGLRKTHLMSLTDVSPRLGTFDTIVMFGNNFGLFGDFNRARRLLRRFAGMTSPNARIIAESMDPYGIKGRNRVLQGHLEYHRQNRARGRMGGQVRIRIRYQGYATPWLDWLLVSREEMRRIVKGTGWKIGRIYDSKGPSYVAILEKVIPSNQRRKGGKGR